MNSPKKQIIILFLGLVLWAGTEIALSQVLQVQPVNIDKGPLLFFYHPENFMGISIPGSAPGVRESLYVYDPTIDLQPQRLWRSDHAQLKPLSRLDPNLVLFEHKNRLFLVDLPQGKADSILPNNKNTELIEVERSKIYFLERQHPYRGGYMLKSDENGNTVVTGYSPPRDNICVLDSSATDKPKRISELEVERVLDVDEQWFWVITAGKNRKLCRIQKDGKIEEIIPFDSHWIASLTDFQFSPDRKFLALALYHDEHDFHKERKLIVVDLKKNETVFMREGINVNYPGINIGGGGSKLYFYWNDDISLEYLAGTADSAEMVYVDAAKGIILEEENKIKRIKLKSAIFGTLTVLAEKLQNQSCFYQKNGLLFFKEEPTPVASVLNQQGQKVSEFFISPQGEWAAFLSPEDNNIYIVDGRKKRKTLLIVGWSYDIMWLPSIK